MGVPNKLDPSKSPFRIYDGIDYREFWKGVAKDKLDELERRIIEELLPASGHRIIDIGCGFGRLADCYLSRFENAVMLDGSMDLLKRAQEKTAGKAVYIAAGADHIPFKDASFDCALMIRVFHHLPDPQTTLLELNRILCVPGCLVFSYSNKRNARQFLLWLFRGTKFNPFTLEPKGKGTPFVHYHPKHVDQMLNNAHFHHSTFRGAGVMDKIAERVGPFSRFVPSGMGIASLLGQIKLAPWIIGQTIPGGVKNMLKAGRIQDLLTCPICKNDLRFSSDAYLCLHCGRNYPVVGEILDFRID
jgi:ubiquinone/menaquinone biosynthesis C-methylase UbiE